MSDGSLSQEEIDALLQGADDLGGAFEEDQPPAGISEKEKNELLALAKEMGNAMGMTLSTITGKTAQFSDPQIDILSSNEYISQAPENPVQVVCNYTGNVQGDHSYIISREVAKQVAALMMAQEEGELTDMAISALNEGFNQMSGAALNILEEKTELRLGTDNLTVEKKESTDQLQLPTGSFIRVRYNFTSDGESSFVDEIMGLNASRSIAAGVMSKKGIKVPQTPSQQPQQIFTPGIQQAPTFTQAPQAGGGGVGVQPVQFSPLSPAEQGGVSGNIGLLMDVSMQLTVELGRTKMLIKDILSMGEGTIVELDKLAGEPVDLLVNGKLIAKGEVVVIDENFGVRVTDIISPMERISNL